MQRCRPTAGADSFSGTTSDVLACKSWPLEAVCPRPPIWSTATTAAGRCCSSSRRPQESGLLLSTSYPALGAGEQPSAPRPISPRPAQSRPANLVPSGLIDKTPLPAHHVWSSSVRAQGISKQSTRALSGDAVEPRSCRSLLSRCPKEASDRAAIWRL